MSICTKLAEVQQQLKAPKDMKNTFGGYNYRSAESILAAVKPLLGNEYAIIISDDIFSDQASGRVYVKATATFTDGKENIQTSAFAREPLEVKKQAPAQTTGSSSSYARKYALSGLLMIDDAGADPDQQTKHDGSEADSGNELNINATIEMIGVAQSRDELVGLYKSLPVEQRLGLEAPFKKRMAELKQAQK